jgi:membrane-bound metal-dependent hydrolase YbcI (DUF457 family)
MFIGHFAVGFAAKKLNSKPSLGTYFLAAQLLDLLWPTFLLLNIEQAEISNNAANPIPLSFTHYPISHSLLTVVGWGILFGFIYLLIKKNYKTAVLLGVCVISHWLLDLVVHIPDLPLYPGNSSLVGLGLWKSKIGTLVLELALFVVSIALYLRSTTAKNKTGVYATWSLIIFLIIVHLMNVFGAPPPNMEVVAWAGQLQWLFVAWAYWSDRNRSSKDEISDFKLANNKFNCCGNGITNSVC